MRSLTLKERQPGCMTDSDRGVTLYGHWRVHMALSRPNRQELLTKSCVPHSRLHNKPALVTWFGVSTSGRCCKEIFATAI